MKYLIVLMAMSGLVSAQTYTTLYKYDEFSRVNEVEYSTGLKRSVEYADGGQVNKIYQTKDGQRRLFQNNHFDQFGRVEKVDFITQHGQLITSSVQFDNLGRIQRATRKLGPSTVFEARQISYDSQDRIVEFMRNDGHLGVLSNNTSIGYEYENGQLAEFTIGPNSTTYHYSNGNLVGRDALSHYDPTTNTSIEISEYFMPLESVNANNQMENYEYDENGRTLFDGVFRYRYNVLGKLALVTTASGHPIESYEYDSRGHRIKTISRNGVLISLADLNGEVYQTEDGESVVNYFGNAEVRYDQDIVRIGDLQNSPAGIVSPEGLSKQMYSPFGEQLLSPVYLGPNGFTGLHSYSKETDLHYMKSRYREDQLARFLTTDPARDFDPYSAASYNLYQYVGNDPINSVDPSGKSGEELTPEAEAEAEDVDFEINETITVTGQMPGDLTYGQATPYLFAADHVYRNTYYNPQVVSTGVLRAGNKLTKSMGLDPGLFYNDVTGFYAALFWNGNEGKWIIAYRGTEGLFNIDVVHDVFAPFVSWVQSDQALYLAQAVADAVGIDNLSVTGHSLGGGLSNYVSTHLGIPSVTFQQAAAAHLGPYTEGNHAFEVNFGALNMFNYVTPNAQVTGTRYSVGGGYLDPIRRHSLSTMFRSFGVKK